MAALLFVVTLLGLIALSAFIWTGAARADSKCIGVGCPAQPDDFWFRVHAGKEPGLAVVTIGGIDPDFDAADSPSDVWGLGGVYPFQTSAVACEVVSSSANDTAAGTGARTVRIVGLDINFNQLTEVVTLNGLTPVATVNSYYRINTLLTLTAGSAGSNVGTVDVRVIAGAVVLSRIGNNGGLFGDGVAHTGVYTTPAGYRVVLTTLSAALLSTTSESVAITIRTRNVGSVWVTRTIFSLNGTGSSHVPLEPRVTRMLEPGADLRITATNSGAVANAGLSAILVGVLMPTTY